MSPILCLMLVGMINSTCAVPAEDLTILPNDNDTEIINRDPFEAILISYFPAVISAPMTVSDSGTYMVNQDITLTAGTAITISTSNVVLDLQGHSINGNGTATNGILISGAQSNVIIKNATILGCTNGIFLNGSSQNIVEDCLVGTCTTGIKLTGATNNVIKGCTAVSCTGAGFRLDTASTGNYVWQCEALNISGAGDVYGFLADSGSNNIFDTCTADTITTSSLLAANQTAGFALNSTETGSQVMNCTANAVTTGATSLASAYGVLTSLTPGTLTTTASFNVGVQVNSVAWSPQKYLAVGTNNTSPQVRVYEYVNNVLTQVATMIHGQAVQSVAWHPTGNFLANGGVNGAGPAGEVKVSTFNGSSLTQVAAFATPASTVNTVSWSPDGKFLVAGDTTAGVLWTMVYDQSGTLTALPAAGTAIGSTIFATAWHPSGKYIAAAGVAAGGLEVRVYGSYDGVNSPTLTGTFAHGATVNSVSWAPDGKYLAIGGLSGTGAVEVRVLNFNTTTGALSAGATFAQGATVQTVAFAPDGKLLAIGGVRNAGTASTNRILSFTTTGAAFTLTSVDNKDIGAAGTVFGIAWTPDEQSVAVGTTVTAAVEVVAYNTTITGGTNCTVKDNTVTNVVGGVDIGFGISASSATNFAFGNVAFNNSIAYSFLGNIYISGLLGSPTLMQNISVPPR